MSDENEERYEFRTADGESIELKIEPIGEPVRRVWLRPKEED